MEHEIAVKVGYDTKRWTSIGGVLVSLSPKCMFHKPPLDVRIEEYAFRALKGGE